MKTPLVPAIAYAVLTVAAIAVSLHTPGPSASASAVSEYERSHITALRFAGFLQLAAALPLAIWAADIAAAADSPSNTTSKRCVNSCATNLVPLTSSRPS